jgi:hypothetical protein
MSWRYEAARRETTVPRLINDLLAVTNRGSIDPRHLGQRLNEDRW